jgi:hypothetical protein
MGHIVALHSLPRAGKDTLAGLLAEAYGYTRVAFATALYKEVSEAFDASVELLQSHDWKTRPQKSLALLNCSDRDFVRVALGQGIAVGEPLTSRQVLQLWGTEYRRRQNKEYWIDQLDEELSRLYWDEGKRLFAISDTRVYYDEKGLPQYNEAEFIIQRCAELGVGYAMVEVVREGVIHTGHGSDDRFPDCFITNTVHNNGEPADMLPQIAPFIAGTPEYNPE